MHYFCASREHLADLRFDGLIGFSFIFTFTCIRNHSGKNAIKVVNQLSYNNFDIKDLCLVEKAIFLRFAKTAFACGFDVVCVFLH